MDLSGFRRKIDSIDEKIVALLNERAKVSLEVGHAKKAGKTGIYAPDRERQVFRRLRELNKGPMEDDAFEAIYREVMSSSIALEKSLKIAFLGAEGSNSHTAALRKFGSQVTYIGCSSIPEVFRKVEQGDCDYAVVPIENSVEGAVTHTSDMLVDSDLQVCAQSRLRIAYSLLAKCPAEKIKKICSNPQALAQCRNWLLQHFPPQRVCQMAVASTTDAVKLALAEKGTAALAPVECARIYRIPVLQSDIQDITHNTTRFFVVGRQAVGPTGHDRTSIVFSIKDKVGALYAMLEPFAKNGINMTRIESRPIKKKAWDYYFFLDFEGHCQDRKVRKALLQLEGMCKFIKILGSYPE